MRFVFLLLAISGLFAAEQDDRADLIAFSYNRPMQLYALLESVETRASHLRKIAVIYRTDSPFQKGYEIVQKRFPTVYFAKQSIAPQTDFKPMVLDLLFGDFGNGADYVVFAVDDIILTDTVNLKEGIEILKETGAYGLYYRLGPNINYFYMLNRPQSPPPFTDAGKGYLSWEFEKAKDEWAYVNTVDFTLYFKGDLEEALKGIAFRNPSELEGHWAPLGTRKQLGICCQRSKMINIPLNIVAKVEWVNRASHLYSAESLNALFLAGLKIDIEAFYQVLNRSVHVDYSPDFIPRH